MAFYHLCVLMTILTAADVRSRPVVETENVTQNLNDVSGGLDVIANITDTAKITKLEKELHEIRLVLETIKIFVKEKDGPTSLIWQLLTNIGIIIRNITILVVAAGIVRKLYKNWDLRQEARLATVTNLVDNSVDKKADKKFENFNKNFAENYAQYKHY